MDLSKLTPEECYVFTGVHYPKVPVCRRPGLYEIMYEQVENYTFTHIRMDGPWTPTVRRRLRYDLDALLSLHGGPGWAISDPRDTKHHKFLNLIGYERIGPVILGDGSDAVIYRLAKKQEENGRLDNHSTNSSEH